MPHWGAGRCTRSSWVPTSTGSPICRRLSASASVWLIPWARQASRWSSRWVRSSWARAGRARLQRTCSMA